MKNDLNRKPTKNYVTVSDMSKKLSVIPLLWLDFENETFSYPPDDVFHSELAFAEYKRKCNKPPKNWPKFEVNRIYGEHVKFSCAESQLKELEKELTSESESTMTDDEPAIKKLKSAGKICRADDEPTIKKPKPAGKNLNSNQKKNNNRLPEFKKPNLVKTGLKCSKEVTRNSVQELSHKMLNERVPHNKELQKSDKMLGSGTVEPVVEHTHRRHDSTSDNHFGAGGISLEQLENTVRKVVKEELKIQNTFLEQLYEDYRKDISEIKIRVKTPKKKLHRPWATIQSLLHLPVMNQQNINMVDEKMEDETYLKDLENFLDLVSKPAQSVAECVALLMKEVTDCASLCQEYSFCGVRVIGKSEKLSFYDTLLGRKLYNYVINKFEKSTSSGKMELQAIVKDRFMKTFKHRVGYEKKKQKDKVESIPTGLPTHTGNTSEDTLVEGGNPVEGVEGGNPVEGIPTNALNCGNYDVDPHFEENSYFPYDSSNASPSAFLKTPPKKISDVSTSTPSDVENQSSPYAYHALTPMPTIRTTIVPFKEL